MIILFLEGTAVNIDKSEKENIDVTEAVSPGKFKWEATIFGVLKKASDNEISIKKLRKKVS